MRTHTIVPKLRSILKWLSGYLHARQQVLNSGETAHYLQTSVGYIYFLVRHDSLPHHKTPRNIYYFKKDEVDAWLRERQRKDLPVFEKPKKIGN